MKFNHLLIIAAVITLVFGLGFVLLPEQLLSLYGITLTAAGIFIARLFGAALIGYAVLNWLIKDTEDAGARRAIAITGSMHAAIGFVVFLIAQLGGVLNALGWFNVAIYLLLALGFGYFTIPGVASNAMKPGTSQ